MNWKNVVRLIKVDAKSGRLIKGERLRRYTESKFFPYLLYGGSLFLGLAIGLLFGNYYAGMADLKTRILFHQGFLTLLLSLPTSVLVLSLVITMMGQIRRSGASATVQPPYWLPITWEEHTLASTLASLMGLPSAFIILICSFIATASVFLGEGPLVALTIFALLGAALLAAMTTEIFRVLQAKFTGAVYKSSGKSAVWVRFLGTIIFLIVFYIVWFAFTSGGYLNIVKGMVSGQSTFWFIPYVWPGAVLVSFAEGLLMYSMVFSVASLLFITVLFYATARLNERFGLYEPPAITVSRGAYAPRPSFLGKLGFSPLEVALIKKDFRAFTRRRELMYVFIAPIIAALMPLMQFFGLMGEPPPPGASPFLFAWIIIGPGAIMAVMLGSMIVGSEGIAVWRLYSSPIAARSLVKCKWAFTTILSLAVMTVYGIVAFLVAHPTLSLIVATSIESVLLIASLGIVALRGGIVGAEFVEAPRLRSIRPLSALVNAIVCIVLGVVILSPLLLRVISTVGLPLPLPGIGLHVALSASGVIALIIAHAFYKMTLKEAGEFLLKAET